MITVTRIMNPKRYFNSMTLDQLVEWYNENVPGDRCGEFQKVLKFDEENLQKVIDYCGLTELYRMIVSDYARKGASRSPRMVPRYFLYDTDSGEMYIYGSESQFKKDFYDAMLEEFHCQELDVESEYDENLD